MCKNTHLNHHLSDNNEQNFSGLQILSGRFLKELFCFHKEEKWSESNRRAKMERLQTLNEVVESKASRKER